MFSNIWFQFAIMAFTVVLVGIVVTAISSLILYRKPKAQAI